MARLSKTEQVVKSNKCVHEHVREHLFIKICIETRFARSTSLALGGVRVLVTQPTTSRRDETDAREQCVPLFGPHASC